MRADEPTLSLPASTTDPRWIEVALADLDAVHRDHLHCERKAAQSALSLVRSYPERTDLVAAVARLAHEETAHVVQVSQLLARRGVTPTWDLGDDYAAALRDQIRRREPERLLDRLLVFALIEARSAERLALLADAITDDATATLYRGLATAEVRHRDTFLELAAATAPATWRDRAAELATVEADLVARLPLRPRIH
ncbi:MAG: tRNA-(ms[2]io[6]A)-hydroxylase [Kofleriaceae bacterium]|nr:tRNA-(ms[2]io[6]A)-hydroxylase [Myxococcales bacterium]MCB9560352.1 tRNA-(ms[2]io[6]A)-hydroxylase [Kofleriaceae bacterium]MCB9571720.1 tRNA-(ms[2]io[6]A)-hydroxylase [Kofleriaceae bacterium]